MKRSPRRTPRVADGARASGTIEVEVGGIAHGGHCVARHDGRVVFVRHALPGERVRVRLTEAGEGDRFWRGEVIKVLEPSPDRVAPAWPAAGPAGVGGAELSHVQLDAQRRWKRTVIAEQFQRLANLEPVFEVAAAPGDEARAGLGWRTRFSLVADGRGQAGMRRYRSHDVVPLEDMPLATDRARSAATAAGVFDRVWAPGAQLTVVAPEGGGEPIVLLDGQPLRAGRVDTRKTARRSVTESVQLGQRKYDFRVAADGFWQVHRSAPEILARAVSEAVGDVTDGTVVELFSGSGLFTAVIADATGAGGEVITVEGDERAVRSARRNLHDAPHVKLLAGDVATQIDNLIAQRTTADVVVLDPPRTGAGAKVAAGIADFNPDRIVYVACDPAALARDVAYFNSTTPRYELTSLRAFDLFPHTHHVECVAELRRTQTSGSD